MIKSIMTGSGLPFRPNRYPIPPAVTYAVYTDSVTTDGPDGKPMLFRHDITLELYEPEQDEEAEAKLEAQLLKRGLHWTKQERYWLQNAQRYQVVYEFYYIEKRRT